MKKMQETTECLMIDDDKDDQEIFEMCVKNVDETVNCTVANDGVEALALLTSNDKYVPNLIFIDVNMPKMNGIECLKAIKNIDRLKDSKVFMYSTTAETEAVIQSKSLGAEDFLIKSPKTADLKERLAKIFKMASKMKNNTEP
jgi:CheY-like chemotaxis protein